MSPLLSRATAAQVGDAGPDMVRDELSGQGASDKGATLRICTHGHMNGSTCTSSSCKITHVPYSRYSVWFCPAAVVTLVSAVGSSTTSMAGTVALVGLGKAPRRSHFTLLHVPSEQ